MPKGVPTWLYALVTTKMATYYEISHLLSVWEVLDLLEILIVYNSNQQLSLDNKE